MKHSRPPAGSRPYHLHCERTGKFNRWCKADAVFPNLSPVQVWKEVSLNWATCRSPALETPVRHIGLETVTLGRRDWGLGGEGGLEMVNMQGYCICILSPPLNHRYRSLVPVTFTTAILPYGVNTSTPPGYISYPQHGRLPAP
jgi:hypothetical protein